MVFGGWAGADLLMETIFPPSMPIYAPKTTSIRGFMVTAVTFEIKVSKENNLSDSEIQRCYISANNSSFCLQTESIISMYCSGNLGLWKRWRVPFGRLTLFIPPPPRETMVCSSSIM